MLKKISILLVIVCWSIHAQAATVFKIATLAPDSTTWMQEMRAGAKKIAEQTEGRVAFKFYPGGVMGNDSTVLRKIRIGQLQGGAVTVGALANVYPDVQIYSLPLQFRSVDELNYVRSHMDDTIKAGLEEKGFINVGIANGGFAYLAGNKPISSINDLKPRKVWVPEGDIIGETVFKSAGISPVALAISDIYTALQTGLLDTVVSNPSSLIAFQWHTKVQYITDSPMVYLMGMFVLDKRAFKKLTAADQEIVKQVMEDIYKRLDDLNYKDNQSARAALEANGVKFIKPTVAEQQSWTEIANDSLKELAEKGQYTKSFYQEMLQHINTFRARQAVQ